MILCGPEEPFAIKERDCAEMLIFFFNFCQYFPSLYTVNIMGLSKGVVLWLTSIDFDKPKMFTVY